VPARVYVGSVYAAGIVTLALAWSLGQTPVSRGFFLIACAAAVLSAPFRIPLLIFGNISIAFAFVFATLILLGTPAAAVAAMLAGAAASLLRRTVTPPLYRIIFNAAELMISSAAAGAVFSLAGGTPGAFDPAHEWAPLLLATLVFFVVNTALVAAAISFTEGVPFVRNWTANTLWTCPAYLAGSFLAATLSLGVQRFGILALVLSVPPFYVLYFALRLYAEKIGQEQKHHQELADIYLNVVEALALALDAKDRTTQRHIRRVQTFAVEIGRMLGLSQAELEALKVGALLHDIGKLAVPEHILCKPGKLSREEFEKMMIHPRIGAEILETINFPFPLTAVVRSHHEKWDGNGYPDRLKGEEIPMAARILSVADCFDALTSDRPYRKPLTKEEALAYIKGEAGVSYDPRVVESLVGNLDRLERLADEVNRTRETVGAPDKRQSRRPVDKASRSTNAMRSSIMGHISAAHEELYALYEIAQSSARSLNLDEVLGFVSSKIAGLLHYRCLILYLYDKDGKVLKARFISGRQASRLKDLEIPLGERMTGWAAVHRMPITGCAHEEPVRREGVRSDLEELLASGAVEKMENAIAAPLLDGDMLLGVLTLYDRVDQPYDDDHLRVISIVARHVATAIKNALQYGASQKTTLTDPITRLPNARYLFVSFEEEMSRAIRQQVPLSIIELDVNNFHEINDQYGHAAGDRILRGLARAVRSQLRGCDTCVRYAGDEFIVIVPGVGKLEIEKLQDRIQRAIENHKFAVHGGRQIRVSASSGSASFPEDGRSIDALIGVADTRMNESKPGAEAPRKDEDGYQPYTGRRHVPVN
jgi:diguanylate cyclase (GGDEF)-like protein/putative nucleotidyltransferase with HDIG domain